jgi:hypothetical protein
MKTMFKLISMKTIGVTALSLALLAGTLATPAFAKGGYNNKLTDLSNRSFVSAKSIEYRIVDFNGHRAVSLDAFKVRLGGGHFDLLILDQEPQSINDGSSAN